MNSAVRLAHISDVHMSAASLGWRWTDFLNKRLTGWLNSHCLPRRRRFQQAERILTILMTELRDRHRPDGVIFSGDATTLGFASELARAAAVLQVDGPAGLPGIAVPGNHDYYTPAMEASGCFERSFGPWQQGERIDGAVYPFARRIGPVWLVGVNSCTGNRLFWDATGRVGTDQLRRLERLLGNLAEGPRILVTHYPVSDAHGRPEKLWHRLRNLTDLLAVARLGGVCLWLHGHRHGGYHIDDPQLAPFPIICAGSATELGRWGYNEYAIEGRTLRAVRRCFQPADDCFREVESFEIVLRC